MAKATKKADPVAEVEDDDIELEELDAEVEEDAPTPKASKTKAAKAAKTKAGRADDPEFGIRQLCALLEERTGKAYQPREVRTLLRKMARDGSGRLDREVSADNRNRYSWSGPDDAEVKAVLKAVKGGEIEQGKKEALDKLKQQKAEKAAATEKAAPKKAKAAKAPEPDEDDDEDVELEEDDD